MERPVHRLTGTPKPQGERALRDSVFVKAVVRAVDGTESETFRVRNISETGMMADGPISFDVGRELFIDLRNVGTVRGQVIWSEGFRFGFRFDTPVDPKAVRINLNSRD